AGNEVVLLPGTLPEYLPGRTVAEDLENIRRASLGGTDLRDPAGGVLIPGAVGKVFPDAAALEADVDGVEIGPARAAILKPGHATAQLNGAPAWAEDRVPARVHVAAGVLHDAAVRAGDEHGIDTVHVRVGADIRRPAGFDFGPVRPEPPRHDPLVR